MHSCVIFVSFSSDYSFGVLGCNTVSCFEQASESTFFWPRVALSAADPPKPTGVTGTSKLAKLSKRVKEQQHPGFFLRTKLGGVPSPAARQVKPSGGSVSRQKCSEKQTRNPAKIFSQKFPRRSLQSMLFAVGSTLRCSEGGRGPVTIGPIAADPADGAAGRGGRPEGPSPGIRPLLPSPPGRTNRRGRARVWCKNNHRIQTSGLKM